MAFLNDPKLAVDEWMATLYHRLPFVVANAEEMGYGAAQKGFARCDTIDFGTTGAPLPEYADAVLPFPPDGMTGVPHALGRLREPAAAAAQPLPVGADPHGLLRPRHRHGRRHRRQHHPRP
jgi:hypothetical protein